MGPFPLVAAPVAVPFPRCSKDKEHGNDDIGDDGGGAALAADMVLSSLSKAYGLGRSSRKLQNRDRKVKQRRAEGY